jgi:hypothetical protein
MSPQNNISGDDELSVQLRQIVNEELARTQGTPQQVAPAPIPLTVNGQTFHFNTPEELSAAVNNMTNAYNTQLAAAQQHAAAVHTPAGQEVTGADEPAFDMTRFVETLTKDPRQAFDYVDQYRYGVKNPSEVVKNALTTRSELDEIKKVLSVYQFKDNHPEFVGTPQVAAVIDQVRQAHGLGFDSTGLEAAYAIAIQRGQIPNPYAQQQQMLQQQQQQQNPYAQPQQQNPYAQYGQRPMAPPPSVPRGGYEQSPQFEQLAESMTPEQIEAVFSRLQ